MSNPKIARKASRIHGSGVFALATIRRGEPIVEYAGRLITHEMADATYGGEDTGHTFLFTLNEQWVVDANVNGNVARWINAGCAPNCVAEVEADHGGDPRDDRVVISALRTIEPGEELTYDYNLTGDDDFDAQAPDYACLCGTPSCRGTMYRLATDGRGNGPSR